MRFVRLVWIRLIPLRSFYMHTWPVVRMLIFDSAFHKINFILIQVDTKCVQTTMPIYEHIDIDIDVDAELSIERLKHVLRCTQQLSFETFKNELYG